MRRGVSGLRLGVLCGVLLGGAAGAQEAEPEVTLKLHHFLGPLAPAQTELFEPWAERVAEQSNGRIEVEIYPSMSLGGSPPQLIRQVRDGVVDIVWTLPGYTPGQFPRVEVFELPFIHTNDAVVTNLAIQDLYEEHLAPDFEGVHPLLVHVHAGQAFHTVDQPIRTLDDVAGLKLRIPTRTGAWVIEALGANPVGMPVPEVPQALSRKVIDGTLIPFEVVLPLKVHELTDYSIEGPDGTRIGTSTFLFAMNKERYESLPDDLRQVIDANSGSALAEEMGRAWMAAEDPGRQAAIDAGTEINVLSEAELARFREALEPVVERWIGEVSAQGIDGQALVDAAREAVDRHSGG